jgi:hypothetical protein
MTTYTVQVQDLREDTYAPLDTVQVESAGIMDALEQVAKGQTIATGDTWRVVGWVGTGPISRDVATLTSYEVQREQLSQRLSAATDRDERHALREQYLNLIAKPARDEAAALAEELATDPRAWAKYVV